VNLEPAAPLIPSQKKNRRVLNTFDMALVEQVIEGERRLNADGN
jgi:hypothetical protein